MFIWFLWGKVGWGQYVFVTQTSHYIYMILYYLFRSQMGSLFLRNICNISHRDDWEFDAILHRNLTIEQQELHKNNKGMDDKEE